MNRNPTSAWPSCSTILLVSLVDIPYIAVNVTGYVKIADVMTTNMAPITVHSNSMETLLMQLPIETAWLCTVHIRQ